MVREMSRGKTRTTVSIAALMIGMLAMLLSFSVPATSPQISAQEKNALPPVRRPRAARQLFDPPAQDENEAGEARGPSLFVVDRQTSRTLETAQQMVRDKDYAQAIQQLQRILDSPEDFAHVPDREHFTSAKQEASRILAALPAEGSELYEREFGSVARQMQTAGVEKGDFPALSEVARKYFHTQAGTEAAYILGTHALDHSDPLTAVRQFERLLALPSAARRWEPMLSFKTAVCRVRAGDSAKAVEILQRLKARQPEARISVGGKTVPLFDRPEEALGWLNSTAGTQQAVADRSAENWSLFRGNAARNAVADAVPFGEPRWSVSSFRAAFAPQLEQSSKIPEQRADQLAQNMREYALQLQSKGVLTLPALHPLVVGDAVLYRTLKGLRAVQLQTGETLWESAVADPHFVQIFERGHDSFVVNLGWKEQRPPMLLMRERLWRDMTWGTLASDEKRVFAIEGLGFWGLLDQGPQGFQNPMSARSQNKLTAYEISSGKMLWEIGGPRGDRELNLAGTFFLGTPLPVGNALYCLGESEGEIRLISLDPATGTPLWVQRLMFPELKLSNYLFRRVGGSSPSYSSGILVCPTTAGVVVAIDVSARQLAWFYRYSTDLVDESVSLPQRDVDDLTRSDMDEQSRWLDCTPTIADGRVLITPRDSGSGELFCLDLADGSLKWKRPRGQGLYIAAVHSGKVIVVGREQIEAWNLADGKDAWPQPLKISGPSGRGIAHVNLYVVPLANGEIATIDMERGLIQARTRLAEGPACGNLAAARGTIIAQTADSVFGFDSIETARQQIARDLERNPNDSAALARRGELRLHLGEAQQGLEDLRRSLALKPNPRARDLLVERLLDGLRSDFAKHRDKAEEIESLIVHPRQRLELHVLLAAGYAAAGDRAAAFKEYLKVSTHPDVLSGMIPAGSEVSVRGDQWLAPRISALYDAADPAQKKAIDQAADARLDALVAASDAGGLKQFVDLFRRIPSGLRARRILVDRLNPVKQAAEMELQLEQFRGEPVPVVAGWATARLARLLIERQHASNAVSLFDELNGDWKDVKCLDGKTGKQLVDEWEANEAVKRARETDAMWPLRHLQARRGEKPAVTRPMPRPLRLLGPRGRSYVDWAFEVERLGSDQTAITASDADGVERWRFLLDPEKFGREFSADILIQLRIREHLLVLAARGRLVALDTLSDPKGPVELWNRPLFSAANADMRTLARSAMAGVAVVTNRLICYQDESMLRAVDILTGETLWERLGVTLDNQIYGDEEYLFIRSSRNARDDVLILRTGDGSEVATRPVPAASNPSFLGVGRLVLNTKNLPSSSMLALTDSFTGRDVWQHEFAPRSIPVIVREDEIAVLEPATGNFTVLGVADGRPRVEQSIGPAEQLFSFAVFRAREHYVLFTYDSRSNRLISEAQMGRFSQRNLRPVAGLAYGFERATGKQIWTAELPASFVDFDQPTNAPVLVLASPMLGSPRPRARGNVFTRSLLDLRNGQIIYRATKSEPLEPFDVRVDRQDRKIELQSAGSLVEVKLTDTPLGEPAPESSKPQREAVRALRPNEKPDTKE